MTSAISDAHLTYHPPPIGTNRIRCTAERPSSDALVENKTGAVIAYYKAMQPDLHWLARKGKLLTSRSQAKNPLLTPGSAGVGGLINHWTSFATCTNAYTLRTCVADIDG